MRRILEMKGLKMRLEGIAIKAKRGGPTQLVSKAEVTLADGLVGDCRGSVAFHEGSRQVTVLSQELWREATGKRPLPWHKRRANLLVSGLDRLFGPTLVGKLLVFGHGVVLEVTGECKPCARMDAIRPGLLDALVGWRGGVPCRVHKAGQLRL